MKVRLSISYVYTLNQKIHLQSSLIADETWGSCLVHGGM